MEWTTSAKATMHKHVSQWTQLPPTSEAYNDLYTDLSAHVEEELHGEGLSQIDIDSLNQVLVSMGQDEFKEDLAADITADQPEITLDSKGNVIPAFTYNSKRNSPISSGFKTLCAWCFTIILPITALLFELATHQSSYFYLDPLPTWFHVMFVALVPATFIYLNIYPPFNDEADSRIGKTTLKRLKISKVMLGFILPVLIYYTLLYLPLLPWAVAASLFLVGLLPLAPLITLVAWILVNYRVNDVLDKATRPIAKKWLKIGLMSGTLALLALETPSYIAQSSISDAISDDDEISEQGIENIRRFGGEESLLYFSYHGEGMNRDFIGRRGQTPAHYVYNFLTDRKVTSEKARVLYFKVTGVPFNSVKPPKRKDGSTNLLGDMTWDADHGSDQVAGVTKDLSLYSSRMDIHVDDVSKLAYLEWIIEFKNDQISAKEARMQIALPHRGFVSKLSLWVNGEERPAAFSSVSKVKAAYQKIAVQQRKDPVLVNVSGADRAMLQCFPVPPSGGIMKMKLGITFPLKAINQDSGYIDLPYIAERNFSIKSNLNHEVYAQGNLKLTFPKASKEESADISTIRCAINNKSLKSERITWNDLTPSVNGSIWTFDPFHEGEDKFLIRQEIANPQASVSKPVIAVIDGSQSMEKWKPLFKELLAENKSNLEVYVATNSSTPLIKCNTPDQVDDASFVGGVDNVPALRRAISVAKEKKASILWLHGSQPFRSHHTSGLEQDLDYSLSQIAIYNVALEDGANSVLSSLKKSNNFKGGHRVTKSADLQQILAEMHNTPKIQYSWTRATETPLTGTQTWNQLARSWAYQATMRSLESPLTAKLAASYQIVTPLSGAVVLESDLQYKETGLDVPTDGNISSIPNVPEPSSSLLLILSTLVFSLRRKRIH